MWTPSETLYEDVLWVLADLCDSPAAGRVGWGGPKGGSAVAAHRALLGDGWLGVRVL